MVMSADNSLKNLSGVVWRRDLLLNSNCKHDSARSHLQPWPEDLKLHLVIVFDSTMNDSSIQPTLFAK